jgi:hypothetical protein
MTTSRRGHRNGSVDSSSTMAANFACSPGKRGVRERVGVVADDEMADRSEAPRLRKSSSPKRT